MIDKYGEGAVQSDGRFKKAREMWVTAVFLLGLSKATGKEYWALPEHAEQTPDTYGICVKPQPDRPNSNHLERMSIEITEWEEHAEGGLAETILRKLKGKKYPDYFILLVLARKPGELVNLDQVREVLQREADKISANEVWIVGRPENEAIGRGHVLERVFPSRSGVAFDLIEEAHSRLGQKAMVKFSRGRGDDLLLEETKYLPLPSLE